ncbi:MAG TPA: glycoside hydrolase family 3 N-terminal domain-containing protein [Myxococcota bacterium]|nr:glycoside hydrolase family 3 N-terminal domain-containing protein [Myxococcota bacterium]
MLLVGFGGRRERPNGAMDWADPDAARFEVDSVIARDIAELHVGGVVLFSMPRAPAAGPGGRNIESPAQLASLSSALQAFSARSREQQRLPPLPLLVAIDQEGGRVDRLPARLGFAQRTVSARAIGAHAQFARRSPEPAQRARQLSRAYAGEMARQLRALGINLNLAPCVDVDVNPRSPSIGALGRSFSSSPEIVASEAAEFVRGFHDHGVLAALKHFPGHGSARGDTHAGPVDVSSTHRREDELLPYRRLIERGYQDVILASHVVNGAIDRTQCTPGAPDDPRTWCPASLSRATLSGLLRGELGFDGVIAADDLTMGAIAREIPLERAIERAIDAGVDLLILGNHREHVTPRAVAAIAGLVESGRLSAERIHRSSERIRALKQRLADTPPAQPWTR